MALGVIAGGTAGLSRTEGSSHFFLDLLDLDRGALERIPVTFLPHGVAQDPSRLERTALFEKKGAGGAIVDVDTLTFTAPITASPGCRFYGHGAFSVDGARLFVVEAELETERGRVSVRDGASLEVIGDLPTHGTAPHDCVLVDEGRTLVVTNGGGVRGTTDTPSVTFVDLATGALKERLGIASAEINAGHIAMGAGGAIAVSSAPRAGLSEVSSPGGVSLRASATERLSTMRKPADVVRRMLGESLSVALHPRGIAAVTNPRGDLLTYWSVAEKRLVASTDVARPRGVVVSRDGTRFVVACGHDAIVRLVDADTLAWAAHPAFPRGVFGGSHVFLVDERTALSALAASESAWSTGESPAKS